MIPDADGKTESPKTDPEQLSRLLELELMQKRAAWARETARYGKIRAISLLFLFVVIVGSLAAFFLMYSTMSEQRAGQSHKPAPASSP